MKRSLWLPALIVLASNPVGAQDTADNDADVAIDEIAEPGAEGSAGQADGSLGQPAAQTVAGATPDQPKAMSGMSILGNEEAPKALVIIPWKTSELGDDISMQASLDDRAIPVDKEVFLRELSFYEVRKSGTREGQ